VSAGGFAGRKALVTGSSSGIGAAIAVALAREGVDVAVNFPVENETVNAEGVVDLIERAGRYGIAIQADVADESQVEDLVQTATENLSRIDILINNAGIADMAPIEEIPIAAWDRMIAVHLRSVFLVTRLVLPGMYERNYGRIINTASQLAYKGAPGLAHYAAAKGGIISFTRSLALEIGERNITANTVAPGATRTPILDGVSDELLEAIRQTIPKGRIAEVEDIVPSYLFLASDGARHMQGQCVSPNGGDVFL
jgi:3-oxoacyl-[acyl-carrier protein] reductase